MRKNRINIGIKLIIFSFVLFSFGFLFSLDLQGNSKEDLIAFEKTKQANVIVSTNNSTNIIKNNNSNTNNPSDNLVSDNKNEIKESNDKIISTIPENNVPPAELSIDAKIELLQKDIKNRYNLDVFFGKEIMNYTVGGYNIEIENNLDKIYNSLGELNNCLSLYPSSFFKEINDGGLPLTIYLIKKYSLKDVTGITEKNGRGVIISVALDFPFSDSFHHEVYHYIEYYINSKGGYYTNWNNYNPSGFSYGSYDNSFTFDSTFSEDAFFVNSYAQSYEYEDRASTFEYMMTNNKISALNYGNNIWLKAKVMCEMIDYYLDTVSSNVTEYWERFIYS